MDARETLTVWLANLPAVLHPNGRTRDQRVKWAAVKKWRGLAGIVARASALDQLGRVPHWPRVVIQVTRYLGRGQRVMDGDNLVAWLKPVFDGLQDAGIVANDSGCTILPPLHARDWDRPRVELVVWEDEARS